MLFKPFHYLLGHAAELALKAFICTREALSERALKRTYGHSLVKCLEGAERLGLGTIFYRVMTCGSESF